MKIKVDWPSRGIGFDEGDFEAIKEIMLDSSVPLTQGTRVAEFERNFSEYLGTNNSIALMSAAHALDISAMLMKIEPGDEVIIPAHTYCATALSFARQGAKVIWADIDPDTWTISLESVSNLITVKTKCVVVVHLYGLISKDIKEIANLCSSKGVFLLEDCAQALGAKLDGIHAGLFGDFACYSFHSQKNITTLGEGGMLTIKNPQMARTAMSLRINGHRAFNKEDNAPYWLPAMVDVADVHPGFWPFKSSMNEIQGILGSRLIAKSDEFTFKRRELAIRMRKELASISEFCFQEVYSEQAHSHHLFPIRVTSRLWKRDDLIDLLSSEYGIKAIVQFYPLNRYDLFKANGMGIANIPNTDMFFDNMMSLPFSLTIEEGKINYMLQSVKGAITRLNS
jgi:perosamine synthetase